ncbi:uncharacterized protein LOC144655470 [Oculina patagonica]
MSRFLIIVFLSVKLVFVHFSDSQSTDLQDSAVSKREVAPEQIEANLGLEGTAYVSFLDSFLEAKRKREKIAPRIPFFRKRKIVPGGVKPKIAKALEDHIEAMEPQFRSASFQQLWQELKEPLTSVTRPRDVEALVAELEQCQLGDPQHTYEYPTDIDSIKRDLVICKIGEILEDNGEGSPENQGNYAHIWSLLKDPLTSCFKVAELSSLMEDLRQCLPRFELAGITYEVPSKMSEVQRDVVICKVDEVLNKPYDDDDDGSGSGEDV